MHSFFTRKCRALWYMFFLLISRSLPAQPKPYTLSALIDTTKTHLPVLFQKQALLNSAQAALTDARHSFLPQLIVFDQLNTSTDNALPGSYLPLGIIPSTSSGVRKANDYQMATGNIAALSGAYELVNFGLRGARIKNAEAYMNLQEADLQKELYYAKMQVSGLYFNLMKNQSRLKSDSENVERYENIFKIIQALAQSGIKAGADSSLAKAELSRARVSYNQTLGTINQLKQQLSYFTGIAADQLVIDTGALKKITGPQLFSPPGDTVNNPLIDYYGKLKNVYTSNEKLISKSYLPRILLTGTTWARGSSIGYNDEYKSMGTGLGYQRFNYMAGLSFQYDLFSGVHKKDKLNVYRLQTRASDYGLQQQKLALQSAAAQADESIRTTEANLLELPEQINAARDTYDQKMAQYKAGIISLIDLTNAAFVLYRSLNDYSETLSDWYLAQLNKASATGNLDLFIQKIK